MLSSEVLNGIVDNSIDADDDFDIDKAFLLVVDYI